LKYLNKLYKEKLISPQSFTTNATSMAKLNESGTETVVGAIPGGANYIFASGPAVSDRWREYDILPPIAGPSGFKSSPNYSATRDIITGDVAISKTAKDPALIMRWVDWLYSEEGTLWHDTNGGREGTEYRKANADEVGLDGSPAKYTSIKVRKPEDNIVWEQFLPSNMTKEYRASWTSPKEWDIPDNAQAPEVQLFKGSMPYEAVAPKNEDSLPNLSVSSDKVSDYTRIKTGVDDYIKESIVKFITGNMDVDKDWDSYVSKLDSIGLKDYISMTQEAYDSKFKK
jgi:putative aldouronate transport system substrate-binding protein